MDYQAVNGVQGPKLYCFKTCGPKYAGEAEFKARKKKVLIGTIRNERIKNSWFGFQSGLGVLPRRKGAIISVTQLY